MHAERLQIDALRASGDAMASSRLLCEGGAGVSELKRDCMQGLCKQPYYSGADLGRYTSRTVPKQLK